MDRLKSLFAKAKDLVMDGIRMFGDCDMQVFAGYGTLFIITSIFPFIMLIISIVNLLPGYSAKDVADILFQIIPDLGPIKDLIESMIINLKDQTGGLLASAAALTTLWSASKGVSAIQKGLDEMDPEEDDRDEDKTLKDKAKAAAGSILKRLLFTLGLIVVIPALLIVEMLGSSISRFICKALEAIDPEGMKDAMGTVDSVFHISSLAVIVLTILLILAIYALLPAKRRTLKSQLPGGILTGLCWTAFTKLFSLFIPRFFNASLYGSLASLFLMLLWLLAVVMILFAGGVLNHVLEERQEKAGAAE